jgi:hypothetical protein
VEARHEQFHFALVLVARTREHVAVIAWREMWCQQSDSRQREGAVADVFQNYRKPSRRSRGLDPVVRRVL